MRLKKHIAIAAVIALISCYMLVADIELVRADGPERTRIVLLHTNDLHFDFNHREAFEEIIGRFRDTYENVFLLDAGDIFVRHQNRWPEPELSFCEKRSRFMIETMNEVGYDAAVLGNHELDIKETITRDSLRLARFPLLGANVEVDTDKFDQPESHAVLETVCGRTIAILGLSTGGTGGVRTLNPVESVENFLHLREEHDLFVLLTHIGVGADRRLAERFGDIDVIIGGHSHTQLNPAETVNGVLVAQTGGHPHQIDPHRRQYLGVVRLWLDNDGKVVRKSGRVITIDSKKTENQALIEDCFQALQADALHFLELCQSAVREFHACFK